MPGLKNVLAFSPSEDQDPRRHLEISHRCVQTHRVSFGSFASGTMSPAGQHSRTDGSSHARPRPPWQGDPLTTQGGPELRGIALSSRRRTIAERNRARSSRVHARKNFEKRLVNYIFCSIGHAESSLPTQGKEAHGTRISTKWPASTASMHKRASRDHCADVHNGHARCAPARPPLASRLVSRASTVRCDPGTPRVERTDLDDRPLPRANARADGARRLASRSPRRRPRPRAQSAGSLAGLGDPLATGARS